MDNTTDKFISAYNKLDDYLRRLMDIADRRPFVDVVWLAAQKHRPVRYVKNDLQALAEVRNLIVHKYDLAFSLATPSLHALRMVETLVRDLTSPPLLIDTLPKKVVTCSPDDMLTATLQTMQKKRYSQLPIYDGGKLKGLLTAESICWCLAEHGILDQDKVKTVMAVIDDAPYHLLGATANALDALVLFDQSHDSGKNLAAIIVTPKGKDDELPTAIATVSDIPRLRKAVRL